MNAKWITPAVTALDENGHIDTEANKRIYEHLIRGGMDGILIFGSIGEFFALPMEEKKNMVREAVAYITGQLFISAPTVWNLRSAWNSLILLWMQGQTVLW